MTDTDFELSHHRWPADVDGAYAAESAIRLWTRKRNTLTFDECMTVAVERCRDSARKLGHRTGATGWL